MSSRFVAHCRAGEYALIVVQTRMQILGANPAGAYTGVLKHGIQMVSKEGIASLWRGLPSVVLGAGILSFSVGCTQDTDT